MNIGLSFFKLWKVKCSFLRAHFAHAVLDAVSCIYIVTIFGTELITYLFILHCKY